MSRTDGTWKATWTHLYSYEIETSRPILNRGCKFTGKVQVDREYTDEEILALVIEMGSSLFTGSKLIESRLLEVR